MKILNEFDDVTLDAAHWDEAAQACRRGIMLARAGVMTVAQLADIARWHECKPAGGRIKISMFTWWDPWSARQPVHGCGPTLELAIADALGAAEWFYVERAAKGGEG